MNSIVFFPNHGRLAGLLLALAATLCGANAFAQSADDPPGRVAQLNYFDGTVSFAPAGFDQWAGVVLNRPLTTGDRLWNDAGARSELHIGSTAVRLNGQTSLSLSRLDDETAQLALTQGSLVMRVRSLPPGQRLEIDTPNLAFTVSQPGDYRFDVDPTGGTTRVAVPAGGGLVYGSDGSSIAMGSPQQITFAGTGLTQIAAQDVTPPDAFDRWALDRDRAEDQSISARYVSRDVIGYQQLDNYGRWDSDPTYGEIWVPNVTVANWAPYSMGHWASIAPWGWTWVDDEPWGFAPFHYGRWTYLGTRWCWVPGPITVRPFYAPALVAFVGGAGGGVNWSISVGAGRQPGVAWFPLAPGEAWHPSYRASPAYVTNVNRVVVNNVHNNINLTNNVTNVYRYQHLPAAVTAVTAAAFTQGQHVRGNAQPVALADLTRAQLVAPPAATRDPRSVFGASRLTQAHTAPPAAVMERRVVANPGAVNRGPTGVPPAREALPGQNRQPPFNAGGNAPRSFTPSTPAAAPATTAREAAPPIRPPLAPVPTRPVLAGPSQEQLQREQAQQARQEQNRRGEAAAQQFRPPQEQRRPPPPESRAQPASKNNPQHPRRDEGQSAHGN